MHTGSQKPLVRGRYWANFYRYMSFIEIILFFSFLQNIIEIPNPNICKIFLIIVNFSSLTRLFSSNLKM